MLDWDGPLVRVSASEVASDLDAETVSFLRDVGLPERLVHGKRDFIAHLSFSEIAAGLIPLGAVLPHGVPWIEEWDSLVVLGYERFEGGASPIWCLNRPTGHIVTVDAESEHTRPELVNTSVMALAKTLIAFRAWTKSAGARSVAGLRASLERVDPSAWPECRWRHLLDYLADASVDEIRCEPDLS